ncbi:MAG: DUF2285 domain-containing protein [Rhodospirillales bacterium]|nr:DUF2285 domain-containing protein [Rhodospirillales bacterium]
MEGLRRGRKPRRIAVDVWGARDGAGTVMEKWHADDAMRSQMRRWIKKAEALAGGGWRDLVPRRPREE